MTAAKRFRPPAVELPRSHALRVRGSLGACFGLLLVASPVYAEPQTPASPPSPAASVASMPTPVDGLGDDLALAFTGYNLFYYAGAIAATAAMAPSGADQAIRVGVQQSVASPAYGDVALYAGYILPLTAAPAMYLVGLAVRDPAAAGAGSAALQALAATALTTGVLKFATGRVYPLNGGDPMLPTASSIPSTRASFIRFVTRGPSQRGPRATPRPRSRSQRRSPATTTTGSGSPSSATRSRSRSVSG
jgi:hypothetical protein